MKFEPHQLTSPLNQFIESIFHYSNFMPDHNVERVVPTGNIFLIFELDGFERFTYHADGKTVKNKHTSVWISGMHKNHISISAHQNSEMLVVQFKPHGAFPYLHLPLHQLNEKIVPAETILGEEILQLRGKLLTLSPPKAKFGAVEEYLNRRFDPNKTASSELLTVIERLQTASVVDYKKIVADYSKTQKHLIDQFKKHVGLTPKYFQRILRFNEILQHIQRSEKIEWSQIAYQCEYADQSHFIKEFKLFSGLNPSKFIQNEFHKQEQNFFPMDREG